MPSKPAKFVPFEGIAHLRPNNSSLGIAETAWVESLYSSFKGRIPKMPLPYRKMGLNRQVLLAWVTSNADYMTALDGEWRKQLRLKDYDQTRLEFNRRFKEEHPLWFALRIVKMESEYADRRRYYAQVRSGQYEEAGVYSQADIDAIFKKQKGKCRYFKYCGHSFDNQRYTIDHRIAVTRGGSSDPSNLQLLCKSCNSIKNNDYIASFERRLKERYSRRKCD